MTEELSPWRARQALQIYVGGYFLPPKVRDFPNIAQRPLMPRPQRTRQRGRTQAKRDRQRERVKAMLSAM